MIINNKEDLDWIVYLSKQFESAITEIICLEGDNDFTLKDYVALLHAAQKLVGKSCFYDDKEDYRAFTNLVESIVRHDVDNLADSILKEYEETMKDWEVKHDNK